ncbi:ferredoxin reductase family protein [Streptomyces sp. MS1.HAVA.3]|uniref:Ferredoxin reductase family protein n=1 Tax=Streptomyces caledonius TaxID=3134107 RepID=A0ABU8U980_9ACTN
MRDAAVRVRGGMLGGAGVVTLLWAAQVRPSARPDALFATAAHLTGLLAGYGVLVLLFLMARVPAVEHGVGADRLARWHAFGGRYVLLLCFGHGLFALLGYAVHEGVDVVSAVRELLAYPALAAAAAGTVLLAAVGVTSARSVRRRVSHETWRGVHLLVYLAAALAFGHQLAGPDLAGAGWFWALAHTAVAVLLVWYRAVVPYGRPCGTRCGSRTSGSRGPGGLRRRLRGAPGGTARRAGPIPALAVPGAAAVAHRPAVLAVRAGPRERPADHREGARRALAPDPPAAPRHAGSGHGAVRRAHRRPADPAQGAADRGRGRDHPDAGPVRDAARGPRGHHPALPGRAEEHLVLRAELEAIAAERQAGLHYLLGPSGAAYDPLAPQALTGLVPDLAEHDVYLCGPPGMAEATRGALLRAGVPAGRIHSECFSF